MTSPCSPRDSARAAARLWASASARPARAGAYPAACPAATTEGDQPPYWPPPPGWKPDSDEQWRRGRRRKAREEAQRILAEDRFHETELPRPLRRPLEWLGERLEPIVAGMFMLLRSSAFADIAGFDEHFYLYYEDVDLCARLRKARYELLSVPAPLWYTTPDARAADGCVSCCGIFKACCDIFGCTPDGSRAQDNEARNACTGNGSQRLSRITRVLVDEGALDVPRSCRHRRSPMGDTCALVCSARLDSLGWSALLSRG